MAEAGEHTEKVTITIRLVRSFEYRSIKNVVIKSIPTSTTVRGLIEEIGKEIQNSSTLPVPFKNSDYDTIKIFTFAHGQKPNNTAINLEEDDKYILTNLDSKLEEYGIKNETELSYFNLAAYNKFKLAPLEQAWS